MVFVALVWHLSLCWKTECRNHSFKNGIERRWKKEHTFIWTNERKIWQEFDYFGAGFYLSLQPYIIASFSLTLSLYVHEFVWCMCSEKSVSVLLCVFWTVSEYSELLLTISVLRKKGLNVVKFTESCFCLFIYMYIFFPFFLYFTMVFLFKSIFFHTFEKIAIRESDW